MMRLINKQVLNKKKRNKGFTLVELLATIAILAILVIILFSSVLQTINKSRLETFLLQAKIIYKESINKLLSEGLNGNKIETIYSEDNSKLDIYTKSEIKYCVILDEKRNADKIAISDGRFYILKDGIKSQDDIETKDIKYGDMQSFVCDKKDFDVDLNCTYKGLLKDKATYINEGYEYTYSTDSKNWSVKVDKNNINDAKICNNISGRPVVKLVGFLVTFDQQKGTGGTERINVTLNKDMPKPDLLPTRTGYTFNGYYTEINGSGTKYYNADGSSARTWNIFSDSTLYANWTANEYTITFEPEDGTDRTTRLKVTYESTMPQIKQLPTRTGYKFQGYYSSQNGKGKQYYDADGTSNIIYTKESDLTLYAYWTANEYTITFKLEDGTGRTTSSRVKYGNNMPKLDLLPTRNGYTFDGYYTETNGSGKKYYNADGTSGYQYTQDKDLTLYANWKLDKIACDDLQNVLQCDTTDTSKLINYTGICSYECEGTTKDNFKIKFLTRGTLTLNSSLNVDVFLVGGGGASGTSIGSLYGWGGGGGGGYTKTYENKTLNGSYYIYIGAGGEKNTNCSTTNPALFSPGLDQCDAGVASPGETTYIKSNGTIIYKAKGGYGGSCSKPGTTFGSGGGTCIRSNPGTDDGEDLLPGGSGGSGGGFGFTNMYCESYYKGQTMGQTKNLPKAAKGQDYSTCEFATKDDKPGTCPSGIAYSRGGDGTCQTEEDPDKFENWGADGTANTGDGGSGRGSHSGGSGIVIIRNAREKL